MEVTGSLLTMESCRKTHWLPQTSRYRFSNPSSDILIRWCCQNPRDYDDAFKLNMFALFNHEVPKIAKEVQEQVKDFEFDVELDMDSNDFETFEMPEIFLGRYMHDFKVRK